MFLVSVSYLKTRGNTSNYQKPKKRYLLLWKNPDQPAGRHREATRKAITSDDGARMTPIYG